jgi:mono/diheme cytochrome c family protein
MAMTSAAATQPIAADPRIALFEASQSVFKRHCYNCHGATKQKGGYRLDTKHSIYLGGKSDLPAVVPGNAEESELMYRMQLPRHDDDTMPPEEKGAVSPADIKSIWQWIEAGAYWPDESELSHVVGEYIKIGDANTDALIKLINATGAKAEYNAWSDQSVRIDLGVVDPGQLNSAINQLNQFDQKLTWLDCSDLELPERFFTVVQQLQDLERLHLNGTNISDEQLKVLSKLAKIRYLNLYNTTISDAGLRILQNFSNLEKVYLSQTKVSNQGIAQLQRVNPDLHVIHR